MSDLVDQPATTEPTPLAATPAWLWWSVATFIATLFHLLIDVHIGLFGETSRDMSVLEGAWGLSQSALFGWWLLVTAMAATRSGAALKSSLILTGVLGLLLNGVVAVAAAPPVSDAAPWQDLAHFTAVIAGFLAVRTGLTELRERGSPPGGHLLVISIVLLVVNMAFGAPLNLDAIASG